jgi:hypothetical protein
MWMPQGGEVPTDIMPTETDRIRTNARSSTQQPF